MEETIKAIKPNLSRNEAQNLMKHHAGTFSAQVQKLLYYPYYWVHFEYRVKTLLGARKKQAYCLVDMINNQAATADHFSWEEIDVDEKNILLPDYSEQITLKTAETYLVHSSIHTMKALLVPKKEILDQKTIFKPFWLVRCENSKNEKFLVIVDSTNGKFQII